MLPDIYSGDYFYILVDGLIEMQARLPGGKKAAYSEKEADL